MFSKKINYFTCGATCGIAVIVGFISGFYFSGRLSQFDSEYNLKNIAELSDSAYAVYLKSDPLTAKRAMNNLLDVLNLSLQSNTTQKKVLQLDKTLTLGRLALISEKTGNIAETKTFFEMATENCKDSKSEKCSEADIREWIKRIDSGGTKKRKAPE